MVTFLGLFFCWFFYGEIFELFGNDWDLLLPTRLDFLLIMLLLSIFSYFWSSYLTKGLNILFYFRWEYFYGFEQSLFVGIFCYSFDLFLLVFLYDLSYLDYWVSVKEFLLLRSLIFLGISIEHDCCAKSNICIWLFWFVVFSIFPVCKQLFWLLLNTLSSKAWHSTWEGWDLVCFGTTQPITMFD